jgi:hypothetical protein
LDTIRYRKKGKTENGEDLEWTYVTLDTNESMIQYELFVQENVDFTGNGTSNIELEVVLSTPHDLRPQSVTWVSINTLDNGEVEQKPHSVYTTIGARL